MPSQQAMRLSSALETTLSPISINGSSMVHHVADLDDLLGLFAKAHVDDEFLGLRHLLALFRRRDVDRLAARVHHPLEVAFIGRHQHAAGEQLRASKPPTGCT